MLEEIPKEQSRMPFRHFPSPLILRKNNNDDQNTFFHLILDPSDKVGNVCIDARCGLGMDNFRRKKVHRLNWLSKLSMYKIGKISLFHLVAMILREPFTDQSNQSVIITRVQDGKRSSTIALRAVFALSTLFIGLRTSQVAECLFSAQSEE